MACPRSLSSPVEEPRHSEHSRGVVPLEGIFYTLHLSAGMPNIPPVIPEPHIDTRPALKMGKRVAAGPPCTHEGSGVLHCIHQPGFLLPAL